MIIHGYGAFSIYLPRKENRPFFAVKLVLADYHAFSL